MAALEPGDESSGANLSAIRTVSVFADSAYCAYCAEAVLDGSEGPEHAVPAAINGRFTTPSVCTPCNGWAGNEIDQPWLNDPFVLDARFAHRIPDRRGRLVKRSPWLAGVTDDGARVALGRDGVPVMRNSVVERDETTGTVRITAGDQATLDGLIDRERRRAERQGRSWTTGEQQALSTRPQVTGSVESSPGLWERLAAKAALALLAEARSAAWRRSPSAQILRERMRNMNLTVADVELFRDEVIASFAATPATAVIVRTVGPHVTLSVSLLGIFTLRFLLAEDLRGVDLAWVSDPVMPAHSCHGTLGEVLHARHVALGLL